MLARIVLTGLLAATLMLAQGKKGGGGRGGPDMPNVAFGGGTRLDRIADMLKLSKDQKKDLKATFDDAQRKALAVHEQMAQSHLEIGEAVAGGKSQDEIAKICLAESQLAAQMVEIELKAFVIVAGTLDAEQKPKAGQLFGMMHGMFNGKNWNETQ